jgi:hypothetical protein
MAESIAHDVVKEAQSVGGHQAPSDDIATPSNDYSAGNGQATPISSSPYTADDRDGQAVANDVNGAAATAKSAVVDESADGPHEVQESKFDDTVSALNDSVAQALADASGGSDTDTSRTDVADAIKDAKGHVRAGSVKRPASFKPVSVSKSFLAKSLSASPVVRPGDKSL